MGTTRTDRRFDETMATNYERFFVPLIPRPLAERVLAALAPRPGERLIDIACGTGIIARLAAAAIGPQGTVVGVDPSADMLDVARTQQPAGGADIEWRTGGAESLPLPDASFDLAVNQLGLMLVEDRAAAVGEMARVLVPGGRAAVAVPGRMPGAFEAMGDVLGRVVDPSLAGFVAALFSLDDPEELHHLLAADLADVNVEVSTAPVDLGPPAEFLWSYIHSTPLRGAVVGVGSDELRQVEDEVLTAWSPWTESGRLVVTQPLLLATAQRSSTGE
jgi:SAM-dependent methyltransferase